MSKIEEFEQNVITQKNVITLNENVFGGMHGEGTATERKTQTSNVSGQGLVEIAFTILGADPGSHTDTTHDWNDEGTCG